MKIRLPAIVALLVLTPLSAHANLLNDPGFEDAAPGLFPFLNIAADDPTSWGRWSDRQNFRRVAGPSGAPPGWSGSNFAQQTPAFNGQANTTDQLAQAFSGAGLNGTTLELAFTYLYANAANPGATNVNARVVVVGLNAGDVLEFAAPWDCDTCVELYNKQLGPADTWANFSDSFDVTGNFVALAIAFRFGVNLNNWPDYVSGVDNVSLRSAAVPEPAALTLLGLGLVGIGWRPRHC